MLFDDEDASLLKKWIVKRLEDISDADSDVLADYVLALLRHEQGEDEVKRLCVEQLDDFLREHTEQFVDDVFGALSTKSFLSVNSTLTGGGLSVLIPPSRSSPPLHSSPTGMQERGDSGSENRGQKRSYHDRDRDEEHYVPSGGYRGSKAPRSASSRWRGRGGADAKTGRGGFNAQQSSLPAPNLFGLPAMGSAGFPWVPPDPNDPMAAFLAAQAAAAWGAFPPPLATATTKPIEGKKVVKKVGERCKDYDEKGFCMKGDMCPYEHGLDHIVVPGQEEYDPNDSMIVTTPTTSPTNSTADTGTRGGHRGRGSRGGRGGRGGGGRGGRSEFSLTGPSFDRSNSTLVVENIPVDKLTDAAIKEFFSKFGDILSVEINPLKHLAILKFENWEMAKKAYDSPAAIFDNRFIKVFWFKTEEEAKNGSDQASFSQSADFDHHQHRHHSMPTEEPEIDIEEIKKIQEEKQKIHEEKMLKKKAAEEAAKALEKRKEELLKLQQEEKRKLMEKLAKKHSASMSPPAAAVPATPTTTSTTTTATDATNGDSSQSSAQRAKVDATTAALKAQLEALEAEAHALGIDSNAEEEETFDLGGFGGRGRGRGRFAPRGARGYVPRGRGSYSPYYRGRGSLPARGGAPSMKLDNRPKRVAVTAADLKGEKDEDFRAYLINNGLEYEGIEPHLEKEDTQIVTFKDRRNAEKFVYSGTEIPNVGTVILTWHNAPMPTVPKATVGDSDTQMGDADNTAAEHARLHEEESYDLAEEDEGRWLPE